LATEIKKGELADIICVHPEHLIEKEWREISEARHFRNNIVLACVEDLILSWSGLEGFV
jgi:hypothetical protein